MCSEANSVEVCPKSYLCVRFEDVGIERRGVVFRPPYSDVCAILNKRLSYRRGTARRAMSLEILSTAAGTFVPKSYLKRLGCNSGMTLKAAQGHRNCRYSTGNVSLPIRDL